MHMQIVNTCSSLRPIMNIKKSLLSQVIGDICICLFASMEADLIFANSKYREVFCNGLYMIPYL